MTDFFEVMKFAAMEGLMLFVVGMCAGGILTAGVGTRKWGLVSFALGMIGFWVWWIFSYNPIVGADEDA